MFDIFKVVDEQLNLIELHQTKQRIVGFVICNLRIALFVELALNLGYKFAILTIVAGEMAGSRNSSFLGDHVHFSKSQ